MDEKCLRKILLHIANGLTFIHTKNLVHLDIKPDNIFISINEELMAEKNIIYKIGDLGHVTDIYDPFVEEGDSRYLAREVLQQKYQCLPKADVFSLALTIFVAVRISGLGIYTYSL
jgi:wee1-like protein kinase